MDYYKQRMMKVIGENPKFKSVDNDVIGVVKAFTGLNINANSKGGKTDMCKAAEELERSCEAKGIVQSGIRHGDSESDILKDLQEYLKISLQQAKNYLNTYGAKTV
jgi:tellurite resistance protein